MLLVLAELLLNSVHCAKNPRVPETRPKPDGFGCGFQILPAGLVAGGFEQCWRVWSRAGFLSTRPEPDPLPSLVVFRHVHVGASAGAVAAAAIRSPARPGWYPLLATSLPQAPIAPPHL